ncbi:MAG: response regulator transcription factor, partial [Eubacteriales bacterium]|nr:response regulator transcription factor [Eubacteriales bacterium]
MKQILIIEDDRLIAELERDYLEVDGFEIQIAANGLEGLETAKGTAFDLVLLDVMLPGMNGFEVLRALRAVSNVPVLFVTARKEEVDKIRGLGLGADDYIVKPFSPPELVARVKAHIAIHERLSNHESGTVDECMQFGELKILLGSHQVYAGGKPVVLTNKEFELLRYMAVNPGIVLSKELLFDRVWGMDAMGDTATITVHISRLREKIEKDPANPCYIETV